MPIQRTPLPYHPDSSGLFQPLARHPWAVFLDSGFPYSDQGRYDILSAEPHTTLTTLQGVTRIDNGRGVEEHQGNPLALLRPLLRRDPAVPADLPFSGGAIGYFGYDLAWSLQGLGLPPPTGEPTLPEMAVGLYDWAVVVDHQQQQSWLVAETGEATRNRLALLEQAAQEAPPLRPTGPLQTEPERAAYGAAFRRVQHYIHEGDCYQVNLARRFRVTVEGDPWAGYRLLRRRNPAPFGAYLNTPYGQVLSGSPERFLRLRGEQVETRPIKGTRPRAKDPQRDLELREDLRRHPKDRAENLMIVDLLRNDLGKCCRPGSIRVEGFCELESFATVHHLTSTIRGRLVPGADALDLLQAAFPGGSITGAPKRRAMQIIHELEPFRRGLYCGSIGYLDRNGDMDTNIAIRTLVVREGQLYFWAGGGIVADSDEEGEYQETLHKARAFIDFLER